MEVLEILEYGEYRDGGSILLTTTIGNFIIVGKPSSKEIGDIYHECNLDGSRDDLMTNHEANLLREVFLFESTKYDTQNPHPKYSLEKILTKIFAAKDEIVKKRKEEVLKKLQPFIVEDTSGFLEKLKWRVDNRYWLKMLKE